MSEEKQKVAVKISDLAEAFDMSSAGYQYHLDLETGAILYGIGEDVRWELDQIHEEFSGEGEYDYTKLVEHIEQRDMQDWMKEETLRAIEIENGLDTRFLAIPWVDSRDGYRDMQLFIETVEDEHVKEVLSVAIDGRGAFRRFKNVLYDYLDERERWFAFKDEIIRQRVIEWLDDHGIEAIE